MEIKLNIDLEAAIAGALAPEKLRPILDKHVTDAITSAIKDATGYSSAFQETLKEQLATAMPHGLRIEDTAKFQHVLNASLQSAVGAANAETIKAAFDETLASVLPDTPTSVKLSELMAVSRDGLHVEAGQAFYAHLEIDDIGYGALYLDSDPRPGGLYSGGSASHRASHELRFSKEGRVYALKLRDQLVTPTSVPTVIGRFHGLLMSMYVGRTLLEIDIDSDDVQDIAREKEYD